MDTRIPGGLGNEQTFRWATGIESSSIPHLAIDQYQWTQHDRFWREDLAKVTQDLGCAWLRYSVPWHVVESRRGRFDWSWSDQRLDLCHKLGLNVLIDLVHFGTPTWLPNAFADVDFPEALAEFAHAFASRYGSLVHSISPINEPLITALFSGDVGLWPPHGKSLRTYMIVISRVGQAFGKAVQAIRSAAPTTEILLCDAVEYPTIFPAHSAEADPLRHERLTQDLGRRSERRHLVVDLITGRVNAKHPLVPWLTEHGFPDADLNWFTRNPAKIDVLGLDYYSHSEMELYYCGDQVRQRVPEKLSGLAAVAREYWNRHQIPLMVTETSCCGEDRDRCAWLDKTVGEVRALREEGIPVIGYTWWPLFDHLDWDGAMLHRIGKIHRVGLYHLRRQPTGDLVRQRTALADRFQEIIRENNVPNIEMKTTHEMVEKNEKPATSPPDAGSGATGFPIIAHCHLQWDGVWQRPQQFLSRISRKHDVLFIEGPELVEENAPRYHLKTVPGHPRVTVMQTFFPRSRFHEGGWVDDQRLQLLRQALAGPLADRFERPVQWFYDPMAAPCFLKRLNERAVVYDCMDELSQFRFAPPELIARERRLIGAADVLFVGGRKLHAAKARLHSNAHFYGCGVDVAHFSQALAAETAIPFDIDFLARPILGYFGVVDERLDYELIQKLAAANPHWSVAIIGPTAKIDPNDLPSESNLYWLGRREYATLPAYAKAFSVCLMPFALNEATEYINPTKALEYLASGRPVVSTAVQDVVDGFKGIIKVARNHEEFIQLCRLATDEAQESEVRAGLSLARRSTWEATVENLERHIHEALQGKETESRPSYPEMNNWRRSGEFVNA